MRLDDWLKKRDVSDAEFAGRIGKTRVDVFRYKRGEVMPRPDVIVRIIDATGGEVGIADIYAAHEAFHQAREPSPA